MDAVGTVSTRLVGMSSVSWERRGPEKGVCPVGRGFGRDSVDRRKKRANVALVGVMETETECSGGH